MRNILLAAAIAMALPAAAIAKKADVTCTDGTTSKAGRGACSHHGGVAKKSADEQSREQATKPEGGSVRSEERPGVVGGLFGRKDAAATPRSEARQKSGTPTARCKDGALSYSAHHSGTCSG